jgi:hypothetical protein
VENCGILRKGKPMKNIRFSTCILLAAFILVGCYGPTHHPDPLAGWKADYDHEPDQAIKNDCQDYIQRLPPEEKDRAWPIFHFEDGTGRHAVRITVGLNGATRQHVLIYDKDNKRIKTITYISSHDLII